MDIYTLGETCFLRGGQCCVYKKATKEQCDVLSVDEADIKLLYRPTLIWRPSNLTARCTWKGLHM